MTILGNYIDYFGNYPMPEAKWHVGGSLTVIYRLH